MPYAPEDPRRHEDDLQKRVIEAYARVYDIATGVFEDVKLLVNTEGVTRPKDDDGKSELVSLTTLHYPHSDGMTVGVKIATGPLGKPQASHNGTIADTGKLIALNPYATCHIFQELRRDCREILATYLCAMARQEAGEQLSSAEDYGQLLEFEQLIETLSERIIEGQLPVPRRTWKFGGQGGI